MNKNKKHFLRVGSYFLLLTFLILPVSSHVKALDLADNKGAIEEIYNNAHNNATETTDELMKPTTGNEAPDFNIKRGVKSNEETVIEAEKTPSTNTIDMNDLDSKIKKETVSPKVEGGNKKAVNILATPPSRSRGAIIENVNQDGKDITPKAEEEVTEEPKEEKTEDKKEKTDNQKIPMRQFLTFTTQGGKEFHLIVNYDKDGNEQVQMLTEVSEQDLLNSIEGESVEDKKRQAEEKARLQKELDEEREKREAEELKRKELEEANKPKKKTPWLMYIIIVVAVAGIAYYQFVYKKKQEDDYSDDEESYDEDYSDDDDNGEE